MELSQDVILECNNCGHQNIIDKKSFEVEEYSSERKMGPEIEWDFHGDFNCEQCGHLMECRIMGYEYPEGALNSWDKEVSGCVVLYK